MHHSARSGAVNRVLGVRRRHPSSGLLDGMQWLWAGHLRGFQLRSDGKQLEGAECFTEGDPCDDGDATTSGDVFTEVAERQGQPIAGCLDASACNYNPNAVIDAENCIYVCPGARMRPPATSIPLHIDDNPREYAQANLDCEGNCLNDINANGLCDEDELLDA